MLSQGPMPPVHICVRSYNTPPRAHRRCDTLAVAGAALTDACKTFQVTLCNTLPGNSKEPLTRSKSGEGTVCIIAPTAHLIVSGPPKSRVAIETFRIASTDHPALDGTAFLVTTNAGQQTFVITSVEVQNSGTGHVARLLAALKFVVGEVKGRCPNVAPAHQFVVGNFGLRTKAECFQAMAWVQLEFPKELNLFNQLGRTGKPCLTYDVYGQPHMVAFASHSNVGAVKLPSPDCAYADGIELTFRI